MTEPLTDDGGATVCECCFQRIVDLDRIAQSGEAIWQRVGETRSETLRRRVEEIARKCIRHDPSLDQWHDRRDLN